MLGCGARRWDWIPAFAGTTGGDAVPALPDAGRGHGFRPKTLGGGKGHDTREKREGET